MVIRTAAERPMVQAIAFSNRHFVDGCVAVRHQAVLCEFPVLVTIRAEPLPVVVAIFVSVPYSDAVAGESPELLDEAIFMLLVPLACQKCLGFFAVGREFDAVPPAGIDRVGEGDLGGIAAVPAVFGQADLFDSSFAGERGRGGRDMLIFLCKSLRCTVR